MAAPPREIEVLREREISNIASSNKGDLIHGASGSLANSILTGDEMEGVITHADNAFQLTYDQVVESMRILSIEVDVRSLVEAFARHNLNDDKGEGHFFDELDVDMDL